MEILLFDFMQRAFIAGIVIAVICPAIGLFLVLRRLSTTGDTLAHITMAGVAAGLILHVNAILTALAFAIVSALGIEKLRKEYSRYAELANAIMMSTGVGLAIVLINLGKGDTGTLLGYLFGSLLTLNNTDLALILLLGLSVIIILPFLYRAMFFISFDEEGAKTAGLPVDLVNFLFSILTAITIAIAMRLVGVLLVSSLMVLPVASSIQVAGSFKKAFWLAIAFGVLEVFMGLILSFYLNTAPGGTIVLTAVIVLCAVLTMKHVFYGGQIADGR